MIFILFFTPEQQVDLQSSSAAHLSVTKVPVPLVCGACLELLHSVERGSDCTDAVAMITIRAMMDL